MITRQLGPLSAGLGLVAWHVGSVWASQTKACNPSVQTRLAAQQLIHIFLCVPQGAECLLIFFRFFCPKAFSLQHSPSDCNFMGKTQQLCVCDFTSTAVQVSEIVKCKRLFLPLHCNTQAAVQQVSYHITTVFCVQVIQSLLPQAIMSLSTTVEFTLQPVLLFSASASSKL